MSFRATSPAFLLTALATLVLPLAGRAQEPPEPASRSQTVGSPRSSRYPAVVNRWAVVIGVSEYAHMEMSLRYADDDARALYDLIQTPSAGGFPRENILLLTNEEATTAEVTRALRSFLQRPAREDIVLIYFAGHGAPDPRRPDNLYLLTHDTDPADIAGTALPMRELQFSITENLLAERVVVMADACHSAGLSDGLRAINDPAEVLNDYLSVVAAARPGMALLTSAEATQTAREGSEWGDDDYPGHGVFTYYVLDAMRGAADGYPREARNGVVTVGELFEYVRDRVKEATDDAQHPAIGASAFDRDLPLAVTAGIAANEHLRLGRNLGALATLAEDPALLGWALGQFDEALRLAGGRRGDFGEAHLEIGRALVLAGEEARGAAYLEEAFGDGWSAAPEALELAGIGWALAGEDARAAPLLRRHLELVPDDPEAPLVRAFVEDMEARTKGEGRRFALLVAVGEHQDTVLWDLPGVPNDLDVLVPALRTRGFAESDIHVLEDTAATAAGFRRALEALATEMTSADLLFLHHSGMAFQPNRAMDDLMRPIEPDEPSVFVLHDTRLGERSPDDIDETELSSLLDAMPGGVVFSLDGRMSPAFETLSREAGYALLSAAGSEQLPMEAADSATGRMYGAWSLAMSEALLIVDDEVTPVGLLEAASARIRELTDGRQDPLLAAGEPEAPLFQPQPGRRYRALLEIALRGRAPHLDRSTLDRHRDFLSRRIDLPVPGLDLALVRELRRTESSGWAAVVAIDELRERGAADEELHLEAGLAWSRAAGALGEQALAEAALELTSYLEKGSPDLYLGDALEAAVGRLEAMGSPRRRALLVGIDRYRADLGGDRSPEGAANDVRALRDVLVERHGFLSGDVVVLENESATRAAILQAFRLLAEDARESPALFHFSGVGSEIADGEGGLTLVPWDGRTPGVADIALTELAGIAAPDSTHMVVILDAFTGVRLTAPDRRENVGERGFAAVDDAPLHPVPEVGLVTIYPDLRSSAGGRLALSTSGEWLFPSFADPDTSVVYGRLTRGLVRRLGTAEPGTGLRPFLNLPGDSAEGRWEKHALVRWPSDLFGFGDWVGPALEASIERARSRATVLETISLLERLVEQRNGLDPEGQLGLGIAHFQAGNTERALEALEAAIAQEAGPAAHYHMGRVLLESGSDPERAVSELRAAVEGRPDYAPAYYFLGRALRRLVERETRLEAVQALQRYLASGAPLGHRAVVTEWIRGLSEDAEPAEGR